MPRFVQPTDDGYGVVGAEVREHLLVEDVGVQERHTVPAIVGQEVDRPAVSVVDHLVGHIVDILQDRPQVHLECLARIGVVLKVLEAVVDTVGMQSLGREGLEDSGLVRLLVGLIECEVGVVVFGWLTAVEMNA